MGHIYLTGMMGSGKTITGKALSQVLKKEFVDMDTLIEKKGDNTIARIFEIKGEFEFRQLESEVLNEIASSGEDKVVATGGGVILRDANIELMKKSGKVVYLKTSLDQLWDRLKDSTDRPLLTKAQPYERLQSILEHREGLYEGSADYSVPTDRLTAADVADNIKVVLSSGA